MLILLIFLGSITWVSSGEVHAQRPVGEVSGLLPGVKAPLFQALGQDSSLFSLQDAMKQGPVVLIFYRGHWCPYCNRHLSAVQDSLQLIYEQGASVVAVSPQKPDYLNLMKEKTGAAFTLVYDEGYTISDLYDVTFTPGSRQLFTYNRILMADLKKSQSDDSQRLPVPATYLIGKDGIIAWRQFDPDYKRRSTVLGILNALSMLQK